MPIFRFKISTAFNPVPENDVKLGKEELKNIKKYVDSYFSF